jgi:hypothetical protein
MHQQLHLRTLIQTCQMALDRHLSSSSAAAASLASCQRATPPPDSISAACVPVAALGAAAPSPASAGPPARAVAAAGAEAAASLYGGQGGASTGGESLRPGSLPLLPSLLLLSAPSMGMPPAASPSPSACELPPLLLAGLLSDEGLPPASDDMASASASLGRKLSSPLLRSSGFGALAAVRATEASAAAAARRLPRWLLGLATSLKPEPAAAGWAVGLEPRAGLRSRDAARDSMKVACACVSPYTVTCCTQHHYMPCIEAFWRNAEGPQAGICS